MVITTVTGGFGVGVGAVVTGVGVGVRFLCGVGVGVTGVGVGVGVSVAVTAAGVAVGSIAAVCGRRVGTNLYARTVSTILITVKMVSISRNFFCALFNPPIV